MIFFFLPRLLFFNSAVISALRNLQDKVKKLELERTEAEQNLHTLASETEQYKDMLNHDKIAGKGKQFKFSSYMENGDGYAAHQAKGMEKNRKFPGRFYTLYKAVFHSQIFLLAAEKGLLFLY